MIGAIVALAILAFVALHEWIDAWIHIGWREIVGLAATVAAVGLIGALLEKLARLAWGWLA